MDTLDHPPSLVVADCGCIYASARWGYPILWLEEWLGVEMDAAAGPFMDPRNPADYLMPAMVPGVLCFRGELHEPVQLGRCEAA